MWQDSKQRAFLNRQYQGAMSRAQGQHFEDLIEGACEYYRMKGTADIEKTPEPMRPIKDLGAGRFIAVYTKAAQADFKGIMAGGRGINFEAKHTSTDRLEQDRVTPDQAERLERATALGGISFVLCSFGPTDFFRVPWTVWRAMKEKLGHKYITAREAEPFRVRFGGPGVLLFLENLKEEARRPDTIEGILHSFFSLPAGSGPDTEEWEKAYERMVCCIDAICRLTELPEETEAHIISTLDKIDSQNGEI